MKDRPPELLTFEEVWNRDDRVEPHPDAIGYSRDNLYRSWFAWDETGPIASWFMSSMRRNFRWTRVLTGDERLRARQSVYDFRPPTEDDVNISRRVRR